MRAQAQIVIMMMHLLGVMMVHLFLLEVHRDRMRWRNMNVLLFMVYVLMTAIASSATFYDDILALFTCSGGVIVLVFGCNIRR